MTEADQYAWWHNALARKAAGHSSRDLGPVSDGFPECGFYRRRSKGKTPSAVAIYMLDGEMVALESSSPQPVPGRSVDPVEVWTWVAKDPIPHETYQAFLETGRWPDMDEAVAEQIEVAPGIGHNEGPDPLAVLRDQIESASAGIVAYEKIGDDETLAKAQSLRSRLLELSREADTQRETLKRPHLEAGKAVDATYQPLVKSAKAAADAIARAMGAWETEKMKREREVARNAEEARRAAEEAAREAEAAGAPPTVPAPEPAPAPAPGPAAPIKGAYGRAASVREVRVVTEITDMGALLAFLREHPEMIDLAKRLAQRAVDKGHDVPGVTVEEQRKVA